MMQRLLLISGLLVLTIPLLSQIQEVSFPEGERMVFATRESGTVKWFYKAEDQDEWELVSQQRIHVQIKSEGMLVGYIYRDNLRVSVIDTIQFIQPRLNQGMPLVIGDQIYNTIKIGDFLWMNEDMEGGPFTYEEALGIANSLPGWEIPSGAWNIRDSYHDIDTKAAVEQFKYKSGYTINSDFPINLPYGFKPSWNYYYDPDLDSLMRDFKSRYWLEHWNGPRVIKLTSSSMEFEGIIDRGQKYGLRLVKSLRSRNRPPAMVNPEWPVNRQTSIGTQPRFEWSEAFDPEGDTIYYQLEIHNDYLPDIFIDSITEPFYRLRNHELAKGVDNYEWAVNAVDQHGYFKEQHRFKGYQMFSTTRTNAGLNENDGNNGLGTINIVRPEENMYFTGSRIKINFTSYLADEQYKIYLGTNSPPQLVTGRVTNKINDVISFVHDFELMTDTTYYLKVEGYDRATGELQAESEIRTFYTEEQPLLSIDEIDQNINNGGSIEDIDSEYQSSEELPENPGIWLVSPANNATVSLYYEGGIPFKYDYNIEGIGRGRRYIRVVSPNHPAYMEWQGASVRQVLGDAETFDDIEIEWKMVWYDVEKDEETYESETWKLTVTDNRLDVPQNLRVENGELLWDVEEGVTYGVLCRTTWVLCGYCPTPDNCGTVMETVKEVHDSFLPIKIFSCQQTTLWYEYQVYAKYDDKGNGRSEKTAWVFARHCADSYQCNSSHNSPNLVPKTVPGSSGDYSDSQSSGSSGTGTTDDGFLDPSKAYFATKQTSSGNWTGFGPVQKTIISYETEEKVIDLCTRDETETGYSLVYECKGYNIYYMPNYTPEKGDYDVIGKLNEIGCF